MVGALLARSEAHVLRLSMLYALLDQSDTISLEHLHSAIELWAYAERSVEYIFGDATGDALADAILRTLRQAGELARTEISNLFGRHETSARIDRALQTLLRLSRATMTTEKTGGRSREVWRPA
jgi:hypothetical protein